MRSRTSSSGRASGSTTCRRPSRPAREAGARSRSRRRRRRSPEGRSRRSGSVRLRPLTMENPAASSDPVAPGADSPLGRVAGVFFAPARTFAAIARRPGWVAPLLLATVPSLLATAVLVPRMDVEAAVPEQLAARDEAVSEGRIEKIIEAQKRFGGIAYVWSVVAPTLVGLLLSGVFWLSFKAFGWDLSFPQS